MSIVSVRASGPGRILLVALATLFLASCAGSAPSTPRSGAPVSLAGTAWKAVLVAGQPTVAGTEPTAAFGADRVEGTTGCNSYGGSYRYASGSIDFGDLMSTAMGCEGAISAVEQRFVAALNGASTASVDPTGRLIVDGAGGSITFVAGALREG
jgi:heat shock protein HslJ